MKQELPEVEQALPWMGRLSLIAVGLGVAAWPAWELGASVWPPSLWGVLAGIIVLGAAAIGLLLAMAGILGEGRRWSYPPRTVVIHRRRWRGQWETRFTALDLAAIKVRHIKDSEAPDVWRVELVPTGKGKFAPDRGRRFQMRQAFETRDFATLEKANTARDALRAHLQMT